MPLKRLFIQAAATHLNQNFNLKISLKGKTKEWWTRRMAYASLGVFLFALLINEFRDLIGFAKGYAPYNFAFNFGFFLPAMLMALGLGLAVIGRTIKNWKNWTDRKEKLTFIGLSFPVVGFWTFNLLRLVLTNPY